MVKINENLVRWLQSVFNAPARMIFQQRRSHHITDMLAWLCVTERIQFKITVLVYKDFHWTAPCYMGPLVRVWFCQYWTPGCVRLPGRCCSDKEDKDVTTSPMLPIFHKRLKNHLFRQSYLILFLNLKFCIYPHSGFEVALLLRPLYKILIDWLIDCKSDEE